MGPALWELNWGKVAKAAAIEAPTEHDAQVLHLPVPAGWSQPAHGSSGAAAR
jgi:hypothetical protein